MAKKKASEKTSIISEILYNNMYGTPKMDAGGMMGLNSSQGNLLESGIGNGLGIMGSLGGDNNVIKDVGLFGKTGASLGSAFGPEGALIGGGIGVVAGAIKGVIDNKAQNDLKNQQAKFQKTLNSPLPTNVVNPYGQYGDGGKIKNISKKDVQETYLPYIREQEGDKAGLKNGKYYPFHSVEGGNDTFGLGHKLTNDEKLKYDKGASKEVVENLFYEDVFKHIRNVESVLKTKGFTTKEIKNIPKKLFFGLVDYSFAGVLKDYNKLIDGIKKGDLKTVEKEANLNYKDPNTGKMIFAKRRTNAIKQNYLIPGMQEWVKQKSINSNENVPSIKNNNDNFNIDKQVISSNLQNEKNDILNQSLKSNSINSNENPLLENSQLKVPLNKMEQGGMMNNALQNSNSQQQDNKLWVNIQKGELEVTKDGKLIREFEGPRYYPHEKKQSKEPHGNFVQAEKDNIIIPKKFAKDYKEGDKIRKDSILQGVLNNQQQNPTPMYQMKEGGFVKFDINQIPHMLNGGFALDNYNPNNLSNSNNPFVPDVPSPKDAMDYANSMVNLGNSNYTDTNNSLNIGMNNPSQNNTFYPDAGQVVQNSINDIFSKPLNTNHPKDYSQVKSLLNNGLRDAGILGQLFTPNPINYLPQAGLEARDSLNQIPDKVNIQSSINEMNRSYNTAQSNNNKRSPSVANGLNANLYGENINQRNALEQNKFNQESQMQTNKLGALSNESKQREQYNQGAFKQYTQENQMDKATRNKMLFSALSNQNDISNKQGYSEDTYKIINSMFSQYGIDPKDPYAKDKLFKANPEFYKKYIEAANI